MQIVIDIDEKYLEYIHKAVEVDCTAPPYFVVQNLWESVLNGTPLPKGHGRLIDADALENYIKEDADEWDEYALAYFENADTIIEADKGSENKE